MDFYVQLFLIFTAGVFWGYCIQDVVIPLIKDIKEQKRLKREKKDVFLKHIKKVKLEGDKLINEEISKGKREVHTFQWRYEGVMNEVEIIIDPNIKAHIPGSKEEFEALLKSGDAGKMEDLFKGVSGKEEADSLKTVKKFIFSKESVNQMRAAGISPDEVVAKMLKAAGRMD